jgi:2-oxoglutarate ferredoxin oxidoreductase subunit beta
MNTNTHPGGSPMVPLNPLSVTLSISNVSFVAQAVDWIPELLFEIIKQAFHHKGLAFIRVLQRCPKCTPKLFESLMSDPDAVLLLDSPDGVAVDDATRKVYKNSQAHDTGDIHRAREVASLDEKIPVGILFRDETVPCYEDIVRPRRVFTPEMKQTALERELDKFAIRRAADS